MGYCTGGKCKDVHMTEIVGLAGKCKKGHVAEIVGLAGK